MMKKVFRRPLSGRPQATRLVCAFIAAAAGTAHAIPVEANSPEAYKALEAAGATLVADYGTFRLYDDTQARLNASAAGKAMPSVPAGAVARPDYTKIFFNAGTVETGEFTPARDAAAALAQVSAPQVLFLVKFSGPVKPEWYAALEGLGAKIVDFVPENTYVLYGDAKTAQAAAALPGKLAAARWAGEFKASWKIAPSVNAAVSDRFQIQMVDDAKANAATLAVLDPARKTPILQDTTLKGLRTVTVKLDSSIISAVAARPDVLSIHAVPEPKKNDERQCAIVTNQMNAAGTALTGPAHMTWLADHGFDQAQFTTSNFVVDVTDSGIDNGQTNARHPGLRTGGTAAGASRISYNVLQGTPSTGSTLAGCDGHGNVNSHIIAGNASAWAAGFPHSDASGYRYGMGINPFVKVGSSVIFDPANFTNPSYVTLARDAYNAGARISSNSWGSPAGGSYISDSQIYDGLVRDSLSGTAGNQELVFVFSAGNDGPGANTMGAPGTGKNLITVGASENLHPFGGADACGTADTGADNPNDIIDFSSRGPCDDGRQKPDLVAPGTHITGGVAQQDSPGTNGTALTCFVAEGVCGGVSSNFFPSSGQQWYTASSGTSHSCPGVAGGAALIRQWFINRGITPPSAAMTKAILMNSTRYMNGVSANDNLWSPTQGMGLMDLDRAFDTVLDFFADQKQIFTATGQTYSVQGTPISTSDPVRVTLAWTDAPGSTSGNAFRNNLNLAVTVGSTTTYLGNVFSGANSTTGGTADTKNNVESVFLPASLVNGQPITVLVTAANINSDGVPNNTTALDQDFALVVSNLSVRKLEANQSAMVVDDTTGNGNGNGVLEPGESGVSLTLPILNTGNVAVNSVNGTAVAISPSTARIIQSVSPYGSITSNGGSKSNAVKFTVALDAAHPCGTPVDLTVRADNDGAPFVLTYAIPTGAIVANPTPFSTSSNVNLAISSSGSPTVVGTLNVAQTGTITKVAPFIDINHTYVSDLTITLTSPSGRTVTLFNQSGGSGDNIRQVTFDDAAATDIGSATPPYGPGSFRPASPLSTFIGDSMAGTWTFTVSDAFDVDGGTLNTIGLGIAYGNLGCTAAQATDAFTAKTDDFTTSESWQPTLGADSATLVANGLGNRVHDAYDSYIGLQVNPSSQGRVFGWLENAANDLPYSAVGSGKYARARYAIYYSGPGDSASPTTYNLVPNFRLRLMTRFAVNSMLEVFHNSGTGDPAVKDSAREFGPSKNKYRPSIYRVDLDPVDVPALGTDPNQGLQRGMEVVASLPDFTYVQGTLYLTDSSVSTYPVPDLNAAPVKVYSPSGTAGAADFDNPDILLNKLTIDRNALFTGVITTSTLGDASVIAYGVPGGSVVDTRNVAADKIGLAAFDYNAGNASDVGNPANRLRVEAGKMYHVSFRVASNGASSAHPYMRFRARSVKFQWSRLLEINGSKALGSALYQSIAQQTLPGTGSQNSDNDAGGNWYRMVFPTPLDPQIRADVDGDIATKFPNLSAQPGPGVAASSFRDLKVGFDIADTLSTGAGQETEAANTTVLNTVLIRSYPEIAD